MVNGFNWLKIRDRGSFIRLTGVLFLVYLAAGLWSPLLAVYTKSLGATTGQIGLVMASYQVTTLISQYWWGRYSDRLGRRKPLLLLGTLGLSIAYIAIASAPSYAWLYAARAVEGAAIAAYSTGSLALIGDLLEDQAGRGRLMGTYRTFGSLAFAISALSGGWIADTFGRSVPFLIAAGYYALACILGARIRELPTPARRSASSATLAPPHAVPLERSTSALPADPRAWRALWSFLALLFVWMFGMSAVVSLWPLYMTTIGYTQTAIGGLWALAAMGEVAWLIVAGQLSDRLGRKWVMITGVLCMAGIFVAYTLSPAFLWIASVQIVRSFAYSCFEAPALLYATELGLRHQRGRLAGLYYSAGGLGGICGSATGGFVAQLIGLPLMYRCVAAVLVMTALVIGRVMPRLRPAQQGPGDLVFGGARRET